VAAADSLASNSTLFAQRCSPQIRRKLQRTRIPCGAIRPASQWQTETHRVVLEVPGGEIRAGHGRDIPDAAAGQIVGIGGFTVVARVTIGRRAHIGNFGHLTRTVDAVGDHLPFGRLRREKLLRRGQSRELRLHKIDASEIVLSAWLMGAPCRDSAPSGRPEMDTKVRRPLCRSLVCQLCLRPLQLAFITPAQLRPLIRPRTRIWTVPS